MRTDIRALCVTTWGAVLEVVTQPRKWVNVRTKEKCIKENQCVRVADPNAVDAGMYISINEIVLVARLKQINNDKSKSNTSSNV